MKAKPKIKRKLTKAELSLLNHALGFAISEGMVNSDREAEALRRKLVRMGARP